MTEEPLTPPSPDSLGILGRLGPDSLERPTPKLTSAILAAAGALVAMGVLFLVAGDGNNRGTVAVAGAIAAVVGYAAMFLGPKLVRPAGMAAVIIGVLFFWQGVFIGDSAKTGAINGALLLAAITYLGLYLAGPKAIGKTPFLGFGALMIWQVLINTVESDRPQFLSTNPFDQSTNGTAWMSLVIAAAYIAIAWQFDMRTRRGTATAFATVGGIAFVFAILGVLSSVPFGIDLAGVGRFSDGIDSNVVFLSLVLMAVAVLFAFVGQHGNRRFTTWVGAVGFFAGAYSLAAAIADDNERGVGAVILGIGVLALGAIYAITNDPDGLSGIKAKMMAAADRNEDAPTADPAPFAVPASYPPPVATDAVPTPTDATVVDTAPDVADATVIEPSAPTPPTEPPAPAYTPDWYPDPHGRFDQRYHNGTVWTAYVARNGEQLTDPDGV